MKMHKYTTEYDSAIKKNEMMKFASKWMALEQVILSSGNPDPGR